MICKNCGERMVGDGYSAAIHCPNVDASYVEPDANPIYCPNVEDVTRLDDAEEKRARKNAKRKRSAFRSAYFYHRNHLRSLKSDQFYSHGVPITVDGSAPIKLGPSVLTFGPVRKSE